MINIVSRSLIFKNISGPQKVVENLIKGLKKINYPYVINKRLDYCSCLYIHDDRIALREIKNLPPHIHVVVGPNLYVVPRDLPEDLDISRAVYLVPSGWSKNFWLNFGFQKCPMEVWATGIDTDDFRPISGSKEFVLLYFKQRFDSELLEVINILRSKNIAYKLLHYDKGYAEKDFRNLLKKTRYAVWLGRQESQGIALQETLASGVPILVCDVSSVGHCIGGGELNEEEKKFSDTSSAFYFDERCGIKIKNLTDLPSALEMMENNLPMYRPREYILENLSLEGQARMLLGFYDKYFGVSYEKGMQEKSSLQGDWLNAKRSYVLYLKAKHTFKMLLVELGIWKLLGR